MPPELSPETWTQIRHDYEHTDKPVEDICIEHGVSPGTLRDRMRRWKWTRRRPAISAEGPPSAPMRQTEAPPPAAASPGEPAALAAAEPSPHLGEPCDPGAAHRTAQASTRQIALGLQGATARVLAAIEMTLASLTAAAHPREIERAGRTVAGLTRTLHELNALKSQSPAFDAENDRGRKDNGAFIQELIRKMDAFAARRAAERGEEASGGAALRSI
jgi:transposase-like protein